MAAPDNLYTIRTLEDCAYLLNILFTNLNNIERVYYDIFLDPNPKDVELERYNEQGIIEHIWVPNRAKDKIGTLVGHGNPNNGSNIARPGALYLDLDAQVLYYKASGTDAYGWTPALSNSNFVDGENYLDPSGDASKLTNINASQITAGTLSVERGGTGVSAITGLIKGNGSSAFSSAIEGEDYVAPRSWSGLIVWYPSENIPDGWLRCDGTSLLREGLYSRLFSIIGTTYGAVDNDHFSLPDLRDKYIKGFNAAGGRSLGEVEEGKVGGHTHGLNAVTSGGTPHDHGPGEMKIEAGPFIWRTGKDKDSLITPGMRLDRSVTNYADTNDKESNGPRYMLEATSGKGFYGRTQSEQAHTHTVSGETLQNSEDENTVTNLAMIPIIKY